MSDIVVVGSINMDVTSYLSRAPETGETVFADDIAMGLGGKGANQAVAASRLDASVTLIGCIGDDPLSDVARSSLDHPGLTLRVSALAGVKTGVALIDVSANGGNSIRIGGEANGRLSPERVLREKDELALAKVLLVQHEVPLPASLKAADEIRRSGGMTIMDPAPSPARPWPAGVLSKFDLITPNAHEVASLIGKTPRTLDDAANAAMDMNARGVNGAIVTMGDLGVAWCIGRDMGVRPATDVESVDTVAAGDCFNAAFAVCICEGANYREAIDFACDAAALSTLGAGASGAAPRRGEVERFRESRIRQENGQSVDLQ